ncbi:MAG: hypothetical protein QNK80_02045 [Akkermansiaceae bacterium]
MKPLSWSLLAILRSVSQIERLTGQIEGLEQPKPQPPAYFPKQ